MESYLVTKLLGLIDGCLGKRATKRPFHAQSHDSVCSALDSSPLFLGRTEVILDMLALR